MSDDDYYFTTAVNPSGNRVLQGCNVVVSDNNHNGGATRSMTTSSVLAYWDDPVEWVVGVTDSKSSQASLVTRVGEERHLMLLGNGELNEISSIAGQQQQQQVGAKRPLVVGRHTLAAETNGESDFPYYYASPPIPANTSEYAPITPLPSYCGGGSLSITDQQTVRQLSANGTDVTSQSLKSIPLPLVDAHITYSTRNQLWALYAGATLDRYVHNVLGDPMEGSMLCILNCDMEQQLVQVLTSFELPQGDDQVFEGLAPMWADVNQDGIDDIVTTVSASEIGSRLKVFLMEEKAATTTSGDNDDDKKQFAIAGQVDSVPIGIGNRWLHQLAVAPLGPAGELELVQVQTPHIGGAVRYYQLQESAAATTALTNNTAGYELVLVAEAFGYTSHDIGSRNLDQVVVADLDGDGRLEVVVQNIRVNRLEALQRTAEGDSSGGGGGGVETRWQVELPDAVLRSNIGIVCNEDENTIDLLFSTQSSSPTANNNELVQVRWSPTANDEEVYITSAGRRLNGNVPHNVWIVWAMMLYVLLDRRL